MAVRVFGRRCSAAHWVGALACGLLLSPPAMADLAAAQRWIKGEFQPSTLSYAQQMDEMRWFISAAQPFRGMTVKVVSEQIDTHRYEATVMSRAFQDITGIKVVHDTIPEGDLVMKIQAEMAGGALSGYDMWVNDSDSIGAHYRYGVTVALSDFMLGEGRDVTLPTLDVHDFIGRSFGTGLDGKLYQLPDQQFTNLYWFRADWFARPDLQKRFREKYGYELAVPLNWSAYEDIAEFFSEDVREIDGVRVYGHMDYGKKDPSLGWRFTDAWLSMAGTGDTGLPNGKPVDEWGIRVRGCVPVGASVARGGEVNGPASVYALSKYLDWLKRFAPPEARNMDFTEAGPVAGKGQIAQQIFWYSSFASAISKPGFAVMNRDGTPKWRMAPSPYGAYWREGVKLGYQDAGSWTMLKTVPLERRKAAWLYAQFVVAKSTSLKKTLVGLTPIRESDINSAAMTAAAPRLGGLVEFYRSPARISWTPTGINVPDYPRLAPLWWQNVSLALSGEKTPQQAMDQLAGQMEQTMETIGKEGRMVRCAPKLDPRLEPASWLRSERAPHLRLVNEKPPGKTIEYRKLLEAWQDGRVR
ncbi:carbohydrate ABC transporter substrate-binding protein [Oxalobacteraceae bacterium]|nr:carbohydrate ABC transporter substrate-binding protein [Oxalobacteraceae bacterium]